MKKAVVLFLLVSNLLFSQNNNTQTGKNNFYLDDQLYFGITYNILINLPTNIKQSGFSNSVFLGYIKDLPINKKRNIGFGIGLGYDLDTYFQNLKIHQPTDVVLFENFLDDEVVTNNKLITHSIEMPFEFRFRTSTIENKNFWRLYAGFKLKYIFYAKAEYRNPETQKISNIKPLSNFNYGLTLAAGNGTWNLSLYYGLKKLFKDAYLNGNEKIETKDFKVGLIFYIL